MYSLLNITPEPITKHPQQATPPTMTSQSGDRRLSKLGQPAPEKEQLPCPRCQSTTTKFCYYNNYNLSQPRHFCKSCRRYWTRGGALRDVPVGGGTRNKSSNKRRRCSTTTTATATTTTTTTTNTNNTHTHDDETRTLCPEESAWWSGQMGTGCGLLPLNGNEYGLDYGLGGMDWPLSVGGGSGHTWQLGGGEGGGVAEGDYFSWLELAMSTPANALK